ncbi:hypothetical protein PMAYCL1PPCAC_13985, partial [Pristionchus mayeri]
MVSFSSSLRHSLKNPLYPPQIPTSKSSSLVRHLCRKFQCIPWLWMRSPMVSCSSPLLHSWKNLHQSQKSSERNRMDLQ